MQTNNFQPTIFHNIKRNTSIRLRPRGGTNFTGDKRAAFESRAAPATPREQKQATQFRAAAGALTPDAPTPPAPAVD